MQHRIQSAAQTLPAGGDGAAAFPPRHRDPGDPVHGHPAASGAAPGRVALRDDVLRHADAVRAGHGRIVSAEPGEEDGEMEPVRPGGHPGRIGHAGGVGRILRGQAAAGQTSGADAGHPRRARRVQARLHQRHSREPDEFAELPVDRGLPRQRAAAGRDPARVRI